MCVCTLDVSELVDEAACLSDSTSEEHSLSSYTSESFDDSGKNLMLKLPNELWTFFIFAFFLWTYYSFTASKSYSIKPSEREKSFFM